ncbi:helix-turn-helix domain-containing protein [Maribacter sp. IgM3_T14_3]|uniref:helix-turn-helix domain-containing protein n=1 Tax=Maribacter sp. IgM3_T14_3 TaxID=3415140 RepID=UPI003C701245
MEILLKSLIFAGAVQGVFLIFLIQGKKKKSCSDSLLIAWLTIVSCQLLFYYDSLSPIAKAPHFLQLLGFSLPLASTPTLFSYINSLAFTNRLCFWKYVIHIIPYFVYNIVIFYLDNESSIIVAYGYLNFNENAPNFVQYLYSMPLAIICGGYSILSLFVLLKYQKSLPDNYSYTEKINLNWIKWIVISLIGVFVLLYMIISYGVKNSILNYQNLFAAIGGILSVYLMLVGYFGFRQNTVFNSFTVPSISKSEPILGKESYKNSGLDNDASEQILKKLLKYVETEKPFLDENLSLSKLAQLLDITPNQLSQVINQKTNSNFFNFINSYRVVEVMSKLKNPSYARYTILAIAFESGFRSKASFNKIFKQQVGKTPSQYQKE